MTDTNTEERLAAIERRALEQAGQIEAHQLALVSLVELLKEAGNETLRTKLAQRLDPPTRAGQEKPVGTYGEALATALREIDENLRTGRV